MDSKRTIEARQKGEAARGARARGAALMVRADRMDPGCVCFGYGVGSGRMNWDAFGTDAEVLAYLEGLTGHPLPGRPPKDPSEAVGWPRNGGRSLADAKGSLEAPGAATPNH